MQEQIAALRQWRKEHPKTDLALSFVPYVGTALAVDDFVQDPTWMGAAGLALAPVAKTVKALRGLKKADIVVPDTFAQPWEIKALREAIKAWRPIRGPAPKEYTVGNIADTSQVHNAVAKMQEKFAKDFEGWYPSTDTAKLVGGFRKDIGRVLPDYAMLTELVEKPAGKLWPLSDVLYKGSKVNADLLDRYARALRTSPHVRAKPITSKRGSSSYDPSVNTITLGPQFGRPIEYSDHLIHEMQHGVQQAAGLADPMLGTNLAAAGSRHAYMRNPGEVEARVAALRDLMGPDDRQLFSNPRVQAYMKNILDFEQNTGFPDVNDILRQASMDAYR